MRNLITTAILGAMIVAAVTLPMVAKIAEMLAVLA